GLVRVQWRIVLHVWPSGVRAASIIEIDIRAEAPDEQANGRRCHVANVRYRDVLLEKTSLRIEHAGSLENPKQGPCQNVANRQSDCRISGGGHTIAGAISETVGPKVIARRR